MSVPKVWLPLGSTRRDIVWGGRIKPNEVMVLKNGRRTLAVFCVRANNGILRHLKDWAPELDGND